MAKNAKRRHHIERIKNKRKSYWYKDFKLGPKQLGIVLKTPKLCGCWMCSNQRKHFGDSIQEIKQRAKYE